jgi:hypothetical protein
MRGAWSYVVALAMAIAGMVAGIAWAERSVFCEPGPLQGNPICLLLILVKGGGLALFGLGLGVLLGRLLDERPPLHREPSAPEQYGPGVRTGAAIGTALMGVLYFGWGPWRSGQDLTVALALLFCSPLALGVALGAWFDRRG